MWRLNIFFKRETRYKRLNWSYTNAASQADPTTRDVYPLLNSKELRKLQRQQKALIASSNHSITTHEQAHKKTQRWLGLETMQHTARHSRIKRGVGHSPLASEFHEEHLSSTSSAVVNTSRLFFNEGTHQFQYLFTPEIMHNRITLTIQ